MTESAGRIQAFSETRTWNQESESLFAEIVTAGKIGSAHIRDLKGVLEREKAAMGVLIPMPEATSAIAKRVPVRSCAAMPDGAT